MESEFRKRVYSKFGDSGETSLLYGGRVSKNNEHTEAYGITDEAVSAMGLARALSQDEDVKNLLRDLQRELFIVAAELATDPDKYMVNNKLRSLYDRHTDGSGVAHSSMLRPIHY